MAMMDIEPKPKSFQFGKEMQQKGERRRNSSSDDGLSSPLRTTAYSEEHKSYIVGDRISEYWESTFYV
jgi:hypothetical protein